MLSASELADMQALVASALVDRADVYATDAQGDYTVQVATGVACRLVAQGGEQEGPRVERINARRLLYDPAAVLGEHQQLAIAGARWNIVGGSIMARRETGGGGLAGECLVEAAA